MVKGDLMNNTYSKKELIEDLQKIDEEVDGKMTGKDYEENRGRFSVHTYHYRFGSWSKAKEEANIETTEIRKEDIIQDLERVDDQIDSKLTTEKYQQYGQYGINTIRRTFGKTWNQVKKENDISFTDSGWQRTHSVNENFFKTWTEDSAYVLGYFYADGNLSGNRFGLRFTSVDRELLEIVKESMETDAPIIKRSDRDVYILSVYSEKIYEDVKSFSGIQHKKSATIEFPDIPLEYMNHFVRGYFDGDGSVMFTGRKRLKTAFGSRSKKFISELDSVLPTKGGSIQEVSRRDNQFYTLAYMTNDSVDIYKYLYDNASVFFSEKKEKFERYMAETKGMTTKNKNKISNPKNLEN